MQDMEHSQIPSSWPATHPFVPEPVPDATRHMGGSLTHHIWPNSLVAQTTATWTSAQSRSDPAGGQHLHWNGPAVGPGVRSRLHLDAACSMRAACLISALLLLSAPLRIVAPFWKRCPMSDDDKDPIPIGRDELRENSDAVGISWNPDG